MPRARGSETAPVRRIAMPAEDVERVEDVLDGHVIAADHVPQRRSTSWWSAYRVTLDDGTAWHCRVGTESLRPGLFCAFAEGYRLVREAGLSPTPTVEAVDETLGSRAVLVTNVIPAGPPSRLVAEQVGWSLGALHSRTDALHNPIELSTRRGVDDIAATTRAQAERALASGRIDAGARRLVDDVCDRLDRWVDDTASVRVHGNLWRDVVAYDHHGRPWLRDPLPQRAIPEFDLVPLIHALARRHPTSRMAEWPNDAPARLLAAHAEFVPASPFGPQRQRLARLMHLLRQTEPQREARPAGREQLMSLLAPLVA